MPAAELTASVALDHEVPGLVGLGRRIGARLSAFDVSMISLTGHGRPAAQRAARRRDHRAGDHLGRPTSLGAERIEHGIAAVDDQRLLKHLVEHKIALDVCLTSNVALRVVPDLDHHPIRELVAAGVT